MARAKQNRLGRVNPTRTAPTTSQAVGKDSGWSDLNPNFAIKAQHLQTPIAIDADNLLTAAIDRKII